MAQKKNIAFFLIDKNWQGGINYFNSLTSAINLNKTKNKKIILFVPSDLNNKLFYNFNVKIIRTIFLKKTVLIKIINKMSHFFFKKNIFLERLLKKHGIKYISHSNYTEFKDFKIISWIGDFQYIKFPNFFGKSVVERNKRIHKNLIQKSDKIILSCNYSFKIFLKKYKIYRKKTHILKFIPKIILPKKLLRFNLLKKKFKLTKKFYYIPNQFWIHKNHVCLFKAIKILNKQNIFPQFVLSGKLEDYRNPEYIDKIQILIDKYGNNNIKYLGEISFKEVCSLIYYSNAIINPSYFEGWSTTVEESKIYNKICILSNIPTHLEQNPKYGIYFNPNKPKELAGIIKKLEKQKIKQTKFDYADYRKKREKFGIKYLKLINNL